MNSEKLKDFGIGLGFVALQIVMFRHLEIYDMQPDIVLIYILWIITQRDRTSAILIAAALGLTQDALLDLWGLNMFSKTLMTFIGYNLVPKSSDTQLLLGQIFLIVVIASFVHNLIFLSLNLVLQGYSAELLFWRILIGSSIYTAVLASFIRLFRTR